MNAGRLIFRPEGGDDTFLRNVGSHRTTLPHMPEDGNIYSYDCKELKS
jgi:hypothetical protein